jgi:hypothetical protein
MAVGFTTWTVLPHKPIDKLSPNLWRVNGMMGKVQRQMMLARMDDGRVVVHNAIALDDAEMAELEAWGEPSVLVVPNGFHRQDALIWKQRYPKLTVVAPAAAKKRVEKALRVDATIEQAPRDAHVRLVPLPGMPAEAVLEVTSDSGVTLTFCDALMNQPKLPGAMGIFLGPTGQVSVPRAMRWFFVKDKRALGVELERLASTPNLERVCFGHGKPVTGADAAATLRTAIQTL